MKRLVRKSESSDAVQIKQEIQKLNNVFITEKQNWEKYDGKLLMGQQALDIIKVADKLEELCYNTESTLRDNPDAKDYIYELFEETIERLRVTETIMDAENQAGVLIRFIDSVIAVNNKYLNMKKEENKISILKKLAEGEVTYIATAPITFSAMPQYGERYDDNGLGIDFFSELKSAVKDDMSEMGADGLATYLDLRSSLYDLVKSIIVDVEKQGNQVISKTTVKTKEELDNDEIKELKDYITGQFSDGWGEGFEQRPIGEWDEEEEAEEWDEEEQTNYKDSYTNEYQALAHFWNSKNFNINITKG
jgi:hypothetical protein